MKKIEKWLRTQKPENIYNSKTTTSIYFTISGCKIRLADHIFVNNQEDSDLHIICPINITCIYIVFLNKGLQPFAFKSFEKLTDFIRNFLYMHKIKNAGKNITEDTKKNSIINLQDRTEQVNWLHVCQYIRDDFPEYSHVTKSYKKHIKKLFKTSIDYYEAIELMKRAFANNHTSEDVGKAFNDYINEHL